MTYINLFEQLLRETRHITRSEDGQFSERLHAKCLALLLQKNRIRLFKRLTHLIMIAHQQDVDISTLFFVCPATQTHLRQLFPVDTQDPTDVYDGDLTAVYSDGSHFKIRANALLYLVLAGNLVAELLGFTEFMLRAKRISDAGDNRVRVEALAVDWANLFDKYRQKRGGSSQQERQFKTIVTFLNRLSPSGEFTYLDIHSHHVLDFWTEHCKTQNLCLQRYQKAHQRFVNFVEQFAADEQQSYSDVASQSTEYEGQLDSFSEDDLLSHGCSPMDDWAAIFTDYAEIKFLKSTDLVHLNYLADLPVCAANLGLSALRAHCFGPLENKLIELRRQGADGQQMEELLEREKSISYMLNYSEALEAFTRAAHSFRLSSLACAHILLHHQFGEGPWLLYRIAPDLGGEEGFRSHLALMGVAPKDWSWEFAQDADFFELAYKAFFEKLAQKSSLPEKLQKALKLSQSAWENINRAGFLREQKNDGHLAQLFIFAAARLPNALSHLDAALRRLATQIEDFDEQMEQDFAILLNIFTNIYSPRCHSNDRV